MQLCMKWFATLQKAFARIFQFINEMDINLAAFTIPVF